MKQVLLFGAGKSATVLIDFLREIAVAKDITLTIADADESLARAKAGDHPRAKAIGTDISDETMRHELIRNADIVISMLPPALHYLVAVDCLYFSKSLLTASYVDDRIRALDQQVKEKGILFLCEMGLDPGIDHMSAMRLIHNITNRGGKVNSFRSHCGGLVAPESDNNPWHYKFTWNPRSVILAGKAGAVYRMGNRTVTQPYASLFRDCAEVPVEGLGRLACYPNRDSLSYMPVYGLSDAETFVRTTLRYPSFCTGWQALVEQGFTDEDEMIDMSKLTIAEFLRMPFAAAGVAPTGTLADQLDSIGWNDMSPVATGKCSRAQALQSILEKKWALQPGDRDMIVMLHEIGYSMDGKDSMVRSQLVVKGRDPLHTAMAQTVGLPLGIAAVLALEGRIEAKGVHIPIIPEIYGPVLDELAHRGIAFDESES